MSRATSEATVVPIEPHASRRAGRRAAVARHFVPRLVDRGGRGAKWVLSAGDGPVPNQALDSEQVCVRGSLVLLVSVPLSWAHTLSVTSAFVVGSRGDLASAGG